MIKDSKHTNASSTSTEKVALYIGSKRANWFTAFIYRVRTTSPLIFTSAVAQIFVGLVMVYMSILGHITPLWLASVMSVFGSISTMLGVYLLYENMRTKDEIDTLYKDAIRWVINSQN